MTQTFISQLDPCPSCGEEHNFGWCGISVRPYCKNCHEWGFPNHYPNGPEVAIASWNRRSRQAEREWDFKKLDKYNKEIGVELSFDDLITFHKEHCKLL